MVLNIKAACLAQHSTRRKLVQAGRTQASARRCFCSAFVEHEAMQQSQAQLLWRNWQAHSPLK